MFIQIGEMEPILVRNCSSLTKTTGFSMTVGTS